MTWVWCEHGYTSCSECPTCRGVRQSPRDPCAPRTAQSTIPRHSEDEPIPEDAAIDAAHPLATGRHDIYAEAMRIVGAKHSKGALVDVVNWLLLTIDTFRCGRCGAVQGTHGSPCIYDEPTLNEGDGKPK